MRSTVIREYAARFVRVVSPYVVELEVDLGFQVSARQRFGLRGYFAVGDAARDALERLLSDGTLIIATYRDGGNAWLADVTIVRNRTYIDAVETLISDGHGTRGRPTQVGPRSIGRGPRHHAVRAV
jgi:hypothetical protein